MKAKRLLCEACAGISIEFDPPDRLLTYFRDEYDVSDSVQNNLIVLQDKLVGKHESIFRNMQGLLAKLPETGSALEIACGQGALINAIARRFPEWNCIGLDPSLNAVLPESKPENLDFITDFFSTKHFAPKSQDLIVAHGILNRTPTLEILKNITSLLRPGGWFSVEVVTLENSLFAPFIWDHSYTYSEETFKAYLNHFGLSIVERHDCVSTIQFICRFDRPRNESVEIEAPRQLVVRAERLHEANVRAVGETVREFLEFEKAHPGAPLGLFGAGLYTAVLLAEVGPEKVSFIIDEVRHGRKLLNIPILTPQQALEIKGARVLLYCRPQYRQVVGEKLANFSLPYQDIISTAVV